ncbi:arginyltransferase [Nitrococcus mobilis]|uniref:Aspartate/glutamate leucyltransferase n=1 Tax=Nitrococcus mobilis Nb-231 TaxID=314278 RepID=A4BTI0_9GAMM|nr:arginyltransferase [Nitrococcus mobilis]EAR20936.1 arginyl-tRNA-protein transferase [Nitrococcus mobilis Nb-231]
MSQLDQARTRRLTVLATPEHACPYIAGRSARTTFIEPGTPLNTALYAELIEQGFRRSGYYLYRPRCPRCSACQSLRIPVTQFRARRRHQRCLRCNIDVRLDSVAPRYRDAHFALYCRYLAARHPDSSMANPTPENYQSFLTRSWCNTELLELRENNRLLAVAVVDDLGNALSAVYTFYEPELPERSLGTLSILRAITETRRRGYDYLYLGYWIAGCARMWYKSEFRPHEVLTPTGWVSVK